MGFKFFKSEMISNEKLIEHAYKSGSKKLLCGLEEEGEAEEAEYLERLSNLRDIFFCWQKCTEKANCFNNFINEYQAKKRTNFMTGIRYEFGIDVEKNHNKAFSFYLISALHDKFCPAYYYLFLLLRLNPEVDDLNSNNNDIKIIKPHTVRRFCDYFYLNDFLIEKLKNNYSTEELINIFDYYKTLNAKDYSIQDHIVIKSDEKLNKIYNDKINPIKELALYFLLKSIAYFSPVSFFSGLPNYGMDHIKSLRYLISTENPFGYTEITPIIKFLVKGKKNKEDFKLLFTNEYEFRLVKVLILTKLFSLYRKNKILELPYSEKYQFKNDFILYTNDCYSYVVQEMESLNEKCLEILKESSVKDNENSNDSNDNAFNYNSSQNKNINSTIRLKNNLLLIHMHLLAYLAYINSSGGYYCNYLKKKNNEKAQYYYNLLSKYKVSSLSDKEYYNSQNHYNFHNIYYKVPYNCSINITLHVYKYTYDECNYYFEKGDYSTAFKLALEGFYYNDSLGNILIMLFFLNIKKEPMSICLKLLDLGKEAILLTLCNDIFYSNCSNLFEYCYLKKILKKYLNFDISTYKNGCYDFSTEIDCLIFMNDYYIEDKLEIFNQTGGHRVKLFFLKSYLLYLDISEEVKKFSDSYIPDRAKEEKESKKRLFVKKIKQELNSREFFFDKDSDDISNKACNNTFKGLSFEDVAFMNKVIVDNKFQEYIEVSVNLEYYRKSCICFNTDYNFLFLNTNKYNIDFNSTDNNTENYGNIKNIDINNPDKTSNDNKSISKGFNKKEFISEIYDKVNLRLFKENRLYYIPNPFNNTFNSPNKSNTSINNINRSNRYDKVIPIINTFSEIAFLRIFNPIIESKLNFSAFQLLLTDRYLKMFVYEVLRSKPINFDYYNSRYNQDFNNSSLKFDNYKNLVDFLLFIRDKIHILQNSALQFLSFIEKSFLQKHIYLLDNFIKMLNYLYSSAGVLIIVSKNIYNLRHFFTYANKFLYKMFFVTDFCFKYFLDLMKCSSQPHLYQEYQNSMMSLKRSIYEFRCYLEYLFKICNKNSLEYTSKSFLYAFAQVYDYDVEEFQAETLFNTSNNLVISYGYYLATQYNNVGTIFEYTLLSFWRELKAKIIIDEKSEFYLQSSIIKINEVKNKRLLLNSSTENSPEEKELCVICLEREITKVFFPCLHCICCDSCAGKILLVQKCPFCRKEVIVFH